MTAHSVKLEVTASVAKDYTFWLEDDDWNGQRKADLSALKAMPAGHRGNMRESTKKPPL